MHALGLAGAATLLPRGAFAQATRGPIDLHHHFRPPFVEGGGPPRGWGIDASLASMDESGVAKAVLSPPTSFAEEADPSELSELTRRVNEFAAEAVAQHPTRFGQFTFVPLHDVDAALAEIEHGFDVTGANGVVFPTSYRGRYLSHADFTPIWEELDRRGAVAYFHPRAGACCDNLFPEFRSETSWLEIPYDTGRLVVTLLGSGAFVRFRNIKWVFSHSGGAIPTFAGRIRNLADEEELADVAPEGIHAELRRLYYETGNAASRATLSVLLNVVPESQVFFGSDHPYVSIATNLSDLQDAGLSPETMAAIQYENALRVIPGLAG